MCGILGVFASSGETLSTPLTSIVHALELLHHRGPNHAQLSFFPKNGYPFTFSLPYAPTDLPPLTGVLGHTRLAILDQSEQGHQPMQLFRDTRFWIAYNGEVYNYRELRKALEQQGYVFTSQSDTEVLLALYIAEGPDMIRRLNGMFALAIWDHREQTFFMARDRYGIKPLYYTRLQNNAWALASELKSLLTLPGCSKALDACGLYEHLTFQNTFLDRTLVKDIHLLEAGHWAKLDTRSNTLTQTRYWDPLFEEAPYSMRGVSQQIEELRHLLEQAVQRQLIGEVPIGSFLSGGMDTGSLTALATRQIPCLNTFTGGFDVTGVSPDESGFDEREAARKLAEQLGTRHHELLVHPSDLEASMPQVVWHLDDFRAGISYQNYLVNRMASQHVTVVLSGVGGDELFAGYPWRYQPVLSAQTPQAFEETFYPITIRLLNDAQKNQLLSPAFLQSLQGYTSLDSFRNVMVGNLAEHPLHKALYFDMKTFLHGLLIVEDRLSMAHSLEARVPFLDNALVDFCLKLPAEAKLAPSVDGQTVTSKWILKEALRGLLPDEVLFRKKQGFTPPDASWFRGPSKAYIEQVLLEKRTLERGLFEPSVLKNLLNQHFTGQQNHRFLIWSLLCLEWWQRLFLDVSIPVAPPVASQPKEVSLYERT